MLRAEKMVQQGLPPVLVECAFAVDPLLLNPCVLGGKTAGFSGGSFWRGVQPHINQRLIILMLPSLLI